MVRKHCALTILQFIHSPCFSMKLPFLVKCAINDIAAHRLMFAPSPLLPALDNKTEQGGKKNGEVQSRIFNISFL